MIPAARNATFEFFFPSHDLNSAPGRERVGRCAHRRKILHNAILKSPMPPEWRVGKFAHPRKSANLRIKKNRFPIGTGFSALVASARETRRMRDFWRDENLRL